MQEAATFIERLQISRKTSFREDEGTTDVEKRDKVIGDTFWLKRQTVVGCLAYFAVGLVVASTAVLIADHATGYDLKMVQRLVKIFSVDYELNIPTFFSTLILLFSAVLLAVIATFERKRKQQYFWYWAVLSAGFLFMAFDEMASVHEKLIEPMRSILGKGNLGVFYFAWVVPAIALVAVLGVIFLKFWWNLPVKTRACFLIAAMLYLGGAVGLELIDGNYAEIHGKTNLTYMLLSTVEEALEMAGIIVFIYGLLGYISENTNALVIRFNERDEEVPSDATF